MSIQPAGEQSTPLVCYNIRIRINGLGRIFISKTSRHNNLFKDSVWRLIYENNVVRFYAPELKGGAVIER